MNNNLDEVELNFEVDLKNYNNSTKKYTLKTKIFNDQEVVYQNENNGKIGINQSKKITLNGVVNSPELWSAEIPNLYNVLIELLDSDGFYQKIDFQTGFRRIELKDGQFLINNQPILFKGVIDMNMMNLLDMWFLESQ